jgi:hypothetical protein
MTHGTEGLLPPAGEAGVHLVPERDLGPLAAAAATQGIPSVRVDLHGCSTKAEFLQRMSGALGFRTGTVRNWDALADALGDLRGPGAPGLALLLANGDLLRRAAADDFQTALDVLQASAAEWADGRCLLWVFVALPEIEQRTRRARR